MDVLAFTRNKPTSKRLFVIGLDVDTIYLGLRWDTRNLGGGKRDYWNPMCFGVYLKHTNPV